MPHIRSTRMSVRETPEGSEYGGIKGSRKGIKFGTAGRHITDTEHQDRMKYEIGDHSAYPGQA